MKIDNLEIGTPYMLRNDGVLLECNKVHPSLWYIPIDIEGWVEKQARSGAIRWYIDNTNSQQVKQLLNKLTNPNLTSIEKRSIINEAKKIVNEEFCYVRMSNIRFGGKCKDIYFRIMSSTFDWSDLIWNVVYSYRNMIESVTICHEDISPIVVESIVYHLSDGTPIDKLSVDVFLMSSGRINHNER